MLTYLIGISQDTENHHMADIIHRNYHVLSGQIKCTTFYVKSSVVSREENLFLYFLMNLNLFFISVYEGTVGRKGEKIGMEGSLSCCVVKESTPTTN